MHRFILAIISASLVAAPLSADSDILHAMRQKAEGVPVQSDNWMISAANPLAVDAGARVLREGGTAADAMVAVQAVLGLVEPQSSGLGGGAFLVWYDGKSGEITTLDGRETAPMRVTPELFLDGAGEPLKFYDAVVGGRSVGTPGTPRLMKIAHERWGRAQWSGLFQEAIALAEDGFSVSPRLANTIADDAKRLARFQRTADYFLPDGVPLQAGQTLKNPAYAESLKAFASLGDALFYNGKIAQFIVEAVQQAKGNPGVLDMDDLSRYQVLERPPVCVEYRGYDVCGMGPPSSGGLTVGQILMILGNFDLQKLGANSPEAWRLIGGASRLAFADRGRYMADSDFVNVPVTGLINSGYLHSRARLLRRQDALPKAEAGTPPQEGAQAWGRDESLELPSTSHISIVDSYGNALSMTTTIENRFGSRLMTAGGFLLNNELTDFSFRPKRDGMMIANRVQAGKRPRSSMAPTIVLKDGKLVLVVGSPGGSRIIGYVAKTIIAYVDWRLDVQQAVALPHLINRFGKFDIEEKSTALPLVKSLSALGYKTEVRKLNSGIHAIAVQQGKLFGGADPRREGIVLGE